MASPALVVPTATLYPGEGKASLVVTLTPPAEGPRKPVLLIPIIDVSGSMGSDATAGEGTEGLGFCVLDLVKHATLTLANALTSADSMALVTYSNDASVVLPPTRMDNEGKDVAKRAIDVMEPDDSTNIYAGLQAAVGIANDPEHAEKHIILMLLTDGFPNINPPRGIVPTFKSLPRTNPWTLHTYGFGYKLDSGLLAELAEIGDGLNGFVPDCSMVGTVFINFLSYALAGAALPQSITVSFGGDAVDAKSGIIMYGQPRDLVFNVPVGADVTVSVEGADVPVVSSPSPLPPPIAARDDLIRTLIEAVGKAKSGLLADARESVLSFAARHAGSSDPFIIALSHEVTSPAESEGQLGMSFMEPHFNKWGQHHTRAFLRSQIMQQCMNFKDPSLQFYGGERFRALQTSTEAIFLGLPPPKPSRRPSHRGLHHPVSPSASGGDSSSPAFSMAVFHDRNGGCFQGDARVLLGDGVSRCPIKDIVPGTLVWTPSGPHPVTALVTCHTTARSQPMTRLGNSLYITPWHPVVHPETGEWTFPTRLSGYMDRLLPTVYNLVLSGGHVVDIEGVKAVTLAHGITGPVVGHPFFGTSAVLDDLAKAEGWAEGRPVFHDLVMVRDEVTGQIVGWRDAAAAQRAQSTPSTSSSTAALAPSGVAAVEGGAIAAAPLVNAM